MPATEDDLLFKEEYLLKRDRQFRRECKKSKSPMPTLNYIEDEFKLKFDTVGANKNFQL